MKRLTTLASTLLVMVLFMAPAAWADEVTLNPTVDGWARAGVGMNDNTSDELIVKNKSTETRTYLKFAIPPFAPGVTINSAKLVLRLTSAPAADRTYNLYRSSGVLPDGSWAAVNVPSVAPADNLLLGIQTGTASDVDLEWSNSATKVAIENLLAGGDLSLVVLDPDSSGATAREGQFASAEHATAAIRPRLIINYTPPPDNCSGAGVYIPRHYYDGPNPLPWSTATAGFLVHFTVTAGCEDLVDVKVQGGLASNTDTSVGSWWTCWGDQPCASNENAGYVGYTAVGKNNKVVKWTIPELAAGTSATITMPVQADFNSKGKAACGVKNFTGSWNVSAFWDDGGVLQSVADGPTGQLVVDITCPEP
jgi:hypothetical protein